MSTVVPTGSGKTLRVPSPDLWGGTWLLYNFDSGGDGIKREFTGVLNTFGDLARVARRLKLKIDFVLEATADPTGDPGTNVQLSKRRAERVKDYLLAHGVETTQCRILPYGSDPGHQSSRDRFLTGRAGTTRVTPKGGNEMDRAVSVTMIRGRPPQSAVIDFKQAGWDEIFRQIRPGVQFEILGEAMLEVGKQIAPSPTVKGVPIPTGSPLPPTKWDSDEKVRALEKRGVVDRVMYEFRKRNIPIERQKVEAEYDQRYGKPTGSTK